MDELKKKLDEKTEVQKNLIDEYTKYVQYKSADDTLFYYTKSLGFPRNKKEKQIYESVMSNPYMKDEAQATGFLSRYYFLSASNMYSEIMGDVKMTYEYRKKIVEHVEAFPAQMDDNLILYIRALNNLVNIQDELNYPEEMEKNLAKFDKIQTKSPTIESRIFAYSYALKVTRAIECGNFEECVKFLPEIEDGIKKYGALLHHEFILGFSYNIFCGYFGAGDYKNALKWMNIMLNNDIFLDTRPDVYRFAQIMNMILHFELKNHELLSYAIRSTYRTFLKQQKLFKFETLMLNFIQRSSKFNTPGDFRQGFKDLRDEVIKLQADPFEAQVLSFFDIVSWLESKVTQKSFAEIIRGKWETRRIQKLKA